MTWKLVVASPLPRSEAVFNMLSLFSSMQWEMHDLGEIYLVEGPRAFSPLFPLYFYGGWILGSAIFTAAGAPPLLAYLIGLALGLFAVIFFADRHLLAMRYVNGIWLIAASSEKAYETALLLVNALRGRVVSVEVVEAPKGTVGAAIPQTLLSLVKSTEGLETVVKGEVISRESGTQALSDSTMVSSSAEEASKYERYLKELEKARAEGRISARAYETLKREYLKRLMELRGESANSRAKHQP